MSTRSAAAIVAVMSAVAFADARAQNFIPRGPELNFVKPGGSVLTCSTDAVFTNAVLGNPLCDKTAAGGASSGSTGLFLDSRSPAGKYRSADDALLDHPNDRENWQNGRADDHSKNGDWQHGRDGDHAKNQDDSQGGSAAAPAAAAGSADLILAPVQLNQAFVAAEVTSTPEPASFVLMATGLLGVAVYGRRRSKGREGINN